VFAATKVQRFAVFGSIGHRGEVGALVGAIAKWLFGALAARTPEIFLAGFHLHRVGRFLGYFGVTHSVISLRKLTFLPPWKELGHVFADLAWKFCRAFFQKRLYALFRVC
jgi:hypothetical protein